MKDGKNSSVAEIVVEEKRNMRQRARWGPDEQSLQSILRILAFTLRKKHERFRRDLTLSPVKGSLHVVNKLKNWKQEGKIIQEKGDCSLDPGHNSGSIISYVCSS